MPRRNFYLLSLGDHSHNGFIEQLLYGEYRPTTHTFFASAFQRHVQLEPLCAPNLVTENEGHFQLSIWGPAMELDPDDFITGLQLVPGANSAATLQVEPAEENKMHVAVSWPDTTRPTPCQLPLQLFVREGLSYTWHDLNTNEPENPDTLDHARTYKLEVLTKALSHAFKDHRDWDGFITVSPWEPASLFAWNYEPLWGQKNHTAWTLSIYWKLFAIWWVIPLLIAPVFYHSRNWYNPMPVWRKFLLASCGLTLLASILVVLLANYDGCTLSWRWPDLLTYPLQNTLQSAVVFVAASVLLKRTNALFSSVPI